MSPWERVRRGAVNVEVDAHLQAAVESGRRLRVKLGIDPSSPDIHLGHTVVLGKLRDFQELGHIAVLIIGDFTARIGDPSGRSETRKQLSTSEVEDNAKTYLDQVFKVLDRDATEVRHQSEWFGSMTLTDTLQLAGKVTLAQVIQREDFSKRVAEGHPVGLHELFYPLLQGYDSVAVEADVELGGTDQLFNLLFGREVQRQHGLEPQDILTTPLLEGLDGKQKMSKSLGNYVGVTDTPVEMYGKLMSLPDELTPRTMRLASDMTEPEVVNWETQLTAGANPRDAKSALARAVITRFHSAHDAVAAEAAWRAQFQRGDLPEQIEDRRVRLDGLGGTPVEALLALGLVASKGEARRLVSQRGARLNGVVVDDGDAAYAPADGDLWQVGKRRFLRVRAF